MTPNKPLPGLLLTLSTLLWLAPGVAAAGDGMGTGKDFARMTPDAGGIRRFAEIRPGLARGGEPGELGLQYLHAKGYQTVVSFLTDAAESVVVVRSGMQYVHIPMRSSFFGAELPTDEQVRQFLSVVQDSTRYPMFIHCHAGKDRTGAMSAIYRIEVCGWTPSEAIEEMEAFGFSGRYQRLHRFVEGYSARPLAQPLASASTDTDPAEADTTSSAR